MATRQSSRSTGARPAQKRRAPAKAVPSRGRAPSRAASSSPLRLLLDGRGHDVWGLVLLALAALSALGIWAGIGGPVGRGIAAVAGSSFGLLDLLLPVALAAGGLLLIRGPRADADAGTRARPARRGGAAGTGLDDTATTEVMEPAAGVVPPARRGRHPAAVVAGGLLAVVVVMGFAHLVAANGATVAADGVDAYRGAGGLLGAALAGGLSRLIGAWGAAVVLVALGALSASLLTGHTLGELARWVARASGPARRRVVEWLGGLFRIVEAPGSGGPAASDGDPGVRVVRPYDQDADADADAAPATDKPRKARRRRPAPPDGAADGPGEQLDLGLGPAAAGSPWRLPPMKLLSLSGRQTVDTKALEARGRVLESALAQHGVQTRLVGMVPGPTVTRYELELGTGVKVAKVTSLHKDIAYAMASPDVRIIAPIPGRQAIGVEVPNSQRQVVAVGDILVSDEARRAGHPLEVAVGRDINGRAVMMNLATMPHLLIAGQTGAGKSSCINSIITSVMMRSTPEQVRMILIDPKRVELTQYDRIPHLLTQVVANPKKAANALAWAVKEMERRYDLLSEVGVRDITGYNAAFDKGELAERFGEDRGMSRLPFILIVVDELSDLMMVAPRDVEDAICRIAQMARAVGIHLVIATQRPSVNVITGVIKANIPARLAFAVASATDSKVILDQAGAERLVGKGDMLLLGPASSAPQRIQGAWVEESEVREIAAHWRKQSPEVESQYVEGVEGEPEPGAGGPGGGPGSGEDDDLLVQAMELVVRSQMGSTSMLQRKLKVGFARAGRLMDLLEQRGVVGPSEGSKARDVLMTVEEFENLTESGQL